VPRHITLRELRDHSAAVFRAIEDGEGFIVTRDGTPIAEITPIRRRFVPVEQVKAAFANVGKVDLAQMRAEADESVDPYSRDPWKHLGK
jgi:antitoxin (DNA-binding transcriptional repressor) of toxin-antitoxin stability system